VTSDGVSSSPRVGGCQPRQRHSLETNLDADQCRVLDLGLHVIKVSPKPVPNIRRSSSRPMRTLETLGFKPFPAPQCSAPRIPALIPTGMPIGAMASAP
jgi:hypothetical protein